MSAIEAIAIASPRKPAARIQPERLPAAARPLSTVLLMSPTPKRKPTGDHVNGNRARKLSARGRRYPSGVPFITFEGIEGSGKSTQLALAAERLRTAGRVVRATREPGGTPIAEKIRQVLMDAAHAELEPMAEWLLIEAARVQHVA